MIKAGGYELGTSFRFTAVCIEGFGFGAFLLFVLQGNADSDLGLRFATPSRVMATISA